MTRIKRIRLQSNLPQKEVAARAGITTKTIQNVENGVRRMRTQRRIQDGLARALGVLPSDLFTKEGLPR